MKKLLLLLLTLLACSITASANNITVSNVVLTGQDVTAGTNNAANFTMVQFDMQWPNSWNTGTSWDAAWIFVKFRVGSGAWRHAKLNNNGHTPPAGNTFDVGLQTPSSAFNATTNPGIGAFLHFTSSIWGVNGGTNIRLRWNYGANGVFDNDIVDVQVYAIEMVYVPQGSFAAGDGSFTSVSGQFRNGSTNTPLSITSEDTLTLGGTANGNLANNNATGMVTADDFNNTTTKPLPAAYPKGYKAFYCMKYEITQQQYVDFLNTLTRAQQNTRTGTNLAAGITSVTNRYVMSNTATLQARNGIRCAATINTSNPITFYCDLNGNGTGGETADGQWLACNWLSYMDVSAYLDWCGLRPITELEYEKACRGTIAAVANEYAWGSTAITRANNITNGGASNETTNTAGANAVYNFSGSVQGPMRVGVFATGSTNRVQSGATYYGIMEMSGNLWERPVTVGNATGRAFTGIQGNGVLSTNGNANEILWPGLVVGEVTGATGAGYRGGDWNINAISLRVSDRSIAALTITGRDIYIGGRGVRIAP